MTSPLPDSVVNLPIAAALAVTLADEVSPLPSIAASALGALRAELARARGVSVDELTAAAAAILKLETP